MLGDVQEEGRILASRANDTWKLQRALADGLLAEDALGY